MLVEPRQRGPAAGRRRRPSSTSTRYALVPGPRSRRRHGGHLLPAAAVLRLPTSPATRRPCAAAPRRRIALAESIGQPRADRPAAGVADAARRRSRAATTTTTLLARLEERRRGAPAGHPDRPRARPDPVGQGQPQLRAPETTLRRPAPPQPVPAARSWRGWPRSSASTPPSAPARPTWPAAGPTSWRRSPRPPAGRGRWPRLPTGGR